MLRSVTSPRKLDRPRSVVPARRSLPGGWYTALAVLLPVTGLASLAVSSRAEPRAVTGWLGDTEAAPARRTMGMNSSGRSVRVSRVTVLT